MLADLPPGTDISRSRWFEIWIYPYICWQIYTPSTDILWPRWVHICRSTPRSADRSTLPVLTSYGQDDFKFGRSTPQVLTSHSQDEFKFGRSTPRSAGRSIPPVLTTYDQDEFKFGRSTSRSADRSTPQYWYLVVKMSSNLADLPPWYWHLMVKMSSNLADLSLDLLAELHP